MHQAETAKKLRGLPAFFYSHRCVPRLLDFLAAGKLFWPSFLRGSRSRKNIATKIAQGESNSQSTVIHTVLAECKKRPNGNCKCPLLLPLTTYLESAGLGEARGPMLQKTTICTITTAILVLIKAPLAFKLQIDYCMPLVNQTLQPLLDH